MSVRHKRVRVRSNASQHPLLHVTENGQHKRHEEQENRSARQVIDEVSVDRVFDAPCAHSRGAECACQRDCSAACVYAPLFTSGFNCRKVRKPFATAAVSSGKPVKLKFYIGREILKPTSRAIARRLNRNFGIYSRQTSNSHKRSTHTRSSQCANYFHYMVGVVRQAGRSARREYM